MTHDPSALRSGKGHRDENFPVASRLIHPRHRGAILAFYEFVRIADDIADHASLSERDKLECLDRLEAGLLGSRDDQPEAVALRTVLRERNLTPRHAQDLLTAFRMDVTKLRYRDGTTSWAIAAIRRAGGPLFLDVHGEDHAAWPANDALCAALQVINHLQDCKKDFQALNRVYVPEDALAAAGARVEDLGREVATPELRHCLSALTDRTGLLLDDSAVFSSRIKDFRLAMEVAVIHALARRLVGLLKSRDPLSERVHLGTGAVAVVGVIGIAAGAAGRVSRVFTASHATRNA
jgi:squalene synthase HpnC